VAEIERKELFQRLEFSDEKSDFSQISFVWLKTLPAIKTRCWQRTFHQLYLSFIGRDR